MVKNPITIRDILLKLETKNISQTIYSFFILTKNLTLQTHFLKLVIHNIKNVIEILKRKNQILNNYMNFSDKIPQKQQNKIVFRSYGFFLQKVK